MEGNLHNWRQHVSSLRPHYGKGQLEIGSFGATLSVIRGHLFHQNKAMILVVIFLLLTYSKGATLAKGEACMDGLKRCLSAYIGDVTQHTRDTEICHDVSVFVTCILDLDCDLSQDVKVQSFLTVERGLAEKGLECEKISELKANYLSGGSHKTKSKPSTNSNKSKTDTKTRSSIGNSASGVTCKAGTLPCLELSVLMCVVLFLCLRH